MDYADHVRAAGILYQPLHLRRWQGAGFRQVMRLVGGGHLADKAVLAQIRLAPDAPGAALASFAAALTAEDGDLIVTLTLSAAQVQALPAAVAPGERVTLYWDFWLDGTVTVAGEAYVIGGISRT